LLPRNVAYDGVIAESIALDILYSLPYGDLRQNLWIGRLIETVNRQDVVLRPVAIKRRHYIGHLRKIDDWNGKEESTIIIDKLSEILPENLWIVEVSIPELFSANMRKIGEIILDAMVQEPTANGAMPFILIRLPGWFLLRRDRDGSQLLAIASNMSEHTPLYC
jgi:hypothetical protein